MAAAEYYFGASGALPNQNRPTAFPPQQPQYTYNSQSPPQSNQQLQPYNIPPPPPSYSPYTSSPQPVPQGYLAQPPRQQFPPTSAPYPQAYTLQSQRPPQNGYLGAPLQPQRSHSQPPRVHFADGKTGSDYSDSSDSDSDSLRRRRHRHKHHRSRSSSLDREYDDRGYDDRGYDERGYDDEYEDRSRQSRQHRKTRKSRDTFLGAGAGSIVGDLILPGLGTAAGMLLGGYGGRKHAERRSRSHAGVGRHSEGDR